MYQKQLVLGLTAAGLLMQGSLLSWSRAGSPDDMILQSDFPLAQNQQWSVEESYLLWKPYMENMWYGSKEKFENQGLNTSDKMRVKNPEFDWSSGVRLGLSRYLPHHDSWDVGLTATYFYSDTDDHTKTNSNDNRFFNALLLLNPLLSGNKGSFQWRLNYWTTDLCVGRLFKMTPEVVFHPYFGLRGSWHYQQAHLKASKATTVATSSVKGEVSNDFWGVGPRFGTGFTYTFQGSFSFLANFAASLLVGGQKLSENERLTTVTSGTTFLDKSKSHDSLNVIRTNIEGMIGMGWEKWLNNHTVRIAPSVAFEGSLWFAMNQIYGLFNTIDSNVGARRHGNLGLMGVSFDLQVDF